MSDTPAPCFPPQYKDKLSIRSTGGSNLALARNVSALLSPSDPAVILELVQVVTRHHPVTAGRGSSTPHDLECNAKR